MTIGTPGFKGERLREAREAIGITQTSLADLGGLTRQAISQYETGETTPNPIILQRLSQILQIPQDYFFIEEPPGSGLGEMTPIFFRSRKAELKTARQRARVRQRWVAGLVQALSTYIDFPEPNIPDLGFPGQPERIGPDMVEYAARAVRQTWNLGSGPIGNLTWLLENHGVIVARDELVDSRLEAHSNWYGATPIITLGETEDSYYRMRLSLAHELGHLVMHRRIDEVRLQRKKDLDQIEEQAFRFATHFLFPRSEFLSEMYAPSLDRMLALKPVWGISVQAQLMYAKHCEIADAGAFSRMWRSLTRRGWRTEEPGDDRPRETPVLLQRAVELVAEEQSIRIDALLRLIPIGVRPIATFTRTDEHVLRGKRPEPELKTAGNLVVFPQEGALSRS